MIDLSIYPVLGICGWSGSGKTTVLLKLLQRLESESLSVVVVKRDVHGINLDVEGKDSDRLFLRGADVLIQGPGQTFFRSHYHDPKTLVVSLPALALRYDVILFEGHKDLPVPKVWLLSPDETEPPAGLQGCLAVLGREDDRGQVLFELIQRRLADSQQRTPVYGCVPMGGQSHRMGSPKQLLRHETGVTWLEFVVGRLQQVCQEVVMVGDGDIPETLAGLKRLPDIPDARGPMAGILAAMRWMPHGDWLVSACDLPDLSSEALHWLLQQRTSGCYGVLPRLAGSPGIEPLLAFYARASRRLLEELVTRQEFAPLHLAEHPRVVTPDVPVSLAGAWRNVNSPGDLADNVGS